MQKLGANGLRAVIVVDNCNPATHQALTQIVNYPSYLSPMVWSGSIAQFLRPYHELTERLAKGDDPAVAAWAKTQLASMAE